MSKVKKTQVFEIEPKLWTLTVTAPETAALFKVVIKNGDTAQDTAKQFKKLADYLLASSRGPQAHAYSRLAVEAT